MEKQRSDMLEIQKFLTTNALSALEPYGVMYKRHPAYPNLVLLKYDQIAADFSLRMVAESRGIILDEAKNWEVVGRSFDKFHNYGMGLAAPIDWNTAKVMAKMDGSLCVIYFYDGKWHVATTGTPDAGGQVHASSETFASLFWQVFNKMGLAPPQNTDLCFAFELTSPYNRIVVQYKDFGLTLLGVRNRKTGQELDPHKFTEYPVVQTFSMNTIETLFGILGTINIDVLFRTFGKMNPLQQEGYVVADANFNRIKVKHPGYVALHALRDGWGPRRVMELVRLGETDEIAAVFPEFAADIAAVREKFDTLVAELEAAYARIKDIPIQKDFAMEATKTRCPGALFAVRAGKVPSIKKFLAEMNITNLMANLGVKDLPPPQV